MNFQVPVLKILVSHPDGFAVMADLKRDVAILATSGRDWAERSKRLGARVADLELGSSSCFDPAQPGSRPATLATRPRAGAGEGFLISSRVASSESPAIPEKPGTELKDLPHPSFEHG